ncbi:MAG: HAD family phosphatase [Verrucomicrobiaceae bacterium]|nr:MAG: HAD family phosphatase [Verrucomicrobiaceae bacterium]
MKGVIFDWDGVVIDSSAQHERSWELLSAEIKKPLPDGHFTASFGKKNQEIIPNLLRWADDPTEIARLGDRKEELYRELVREQGVRVLPGARELLTALRDAGIPRSVGSSTPRSNLDAIFAATGLGELFDEVVCGDDVINGKPAPDVFLLAAKKLGLAPADCIVIEDAHVGIAAAHAAGMKVLAVATTHPLDELAVADAAVVTLEEITPDRLRQIAA